jgi:pimeloyl-ACP methyl ester carboxylesterase
MTGLVFELGGYQHIGGRRHEARSTDRWRELIDTTGASFEWRCGHRIDGSETLGDGEHAVNTQPVLFIQGAGSMLAPQGSGRLAAHLAREVGTDYRVIAPEMPHADSPDYQSWRDRIELELAAIDEDVILVGHSFGGSVLLKYLAEGSYRKPVRGLFLVSVPTGDRTAGRTPNSRFRTTLARGCQQRGSSCTTSR